MTAPRLPVQLSHSEKSSWQQVKGKGPYKAANGISALSSGPTIRTPSRILLGKFSPKGGGADMQEPTCFSVPLFASSCAWLSGLFIFIMPETSGVQRTEVGAGIKIEGQPPRPSLAERCQQVAFCLRAVPPPAVFPAAPTEIWPPCHFLCSRPPRRTCNAAGKQRLAWKGPFLSPKSA